MSSPRIFPLQSVFASAPHSVDLTTTSQAPRLAFSSHQGRHAFTTGSSILNPLLALSASVLHYQSSLLDPLLSVSAVDPENSALCRSALPAAVRSVEQLQVPRNL